MGTALTIVGNDSSGGAGIQADIKTMAAHGVYAMSAITALTAQNIAGATGIIEVTLSFLKGQLDDILTDIFPDVVKIGMVSSGGLIEAIEDRLAFYRAANVVIGPVMVSASDSHLIGNETIGTLKEVLLPMASLLTPSIPEAEVLSGAEIYNPGDTETAARAIGKGYRCTVLLKDGHQLSGANDLLYRDRKLKWFKGRRIDSPSTHGIGCTLPNTTASNLAKGMDMNLAVERAKVYLPGALKAQLDLGKGSGPMNHGFIIWGEY